MGYQLRTFRYFGSGIHNCFRKWSGNLHRLRQTVGNPAGLHGICCAGSESHYCIHTDQTEPIPPGIQMPERIFHHSILHQKLCCKHPAEETLGDFRIERHEDFQLYDHFFDNILRQKAHTLSPTEEHLLAQAAELGGAPQNIFTMLNDADIRGLSI